LTIILASAATAAPETIVFGSQDNWHDLVASEGVVVGPGRHGYQDVSLMFDRYTPRHDTELLMQFDSLPLVDAAGHYTVTGDSAELSGSTFRTGTGALLTDGPEDRLILESIGATLFRPGTEWGSFTVEFWLYPATVTEGDTILHWSGLEGGRLGFREQELSVSVHDRSLQFDFRNFFVPPDGRSFAVSLQGRKGLIPRTWTHHQVRFSEETALLEYLVDGRPVDMAYISESGREDGSVYYPRIAAFPATGFTLAERFIGAIDEVRISRRWEDDPVLNRYPRTGGQFLTGVGDLGSPGARLTSVSAIVQTPGLTDVFLYYRISDRPFIDQSDPESSEWTPVMSGSRLNGVTGRFVQVKTQLFPDPDIRETPRVSEVRLEYEADPPPPPPTGLTVRPMDGAVRLEWAPAGDPDIQGYLVYYGDQSGRYFGTESTAGPSPVAVGPGTSVIPDGLSNGALYYFAVGAISRSLTGVHLSREVASRPAKVYE
ncbi:MAG: hypothetical protein E4H09_04275, partial [Spirochaetales bacterium]